MSELDPQAFCAWPNSDGWSAREIKRFERLMREASEPAKGAGKLVSSWDDGRSELPWYTARRGPQEAELRAKCVVIFGCAPEHEL